MLAPHINDLSEDEIEVIDDINKELRVIELEKEPENNVLRVYQCQKCF